jgi:hypothetical protein
VTLRALALVGLVFVGCFGTAPMLESETGVADTIADTTASMCEADEQPLPTAPEGWDGPAWVAIGTAGAPPPPCPAATVGETMFLDTPDPLACACVCDAEDACGTTYSIGAACDPTLTSQGPLDQCAELAEPSAAIDLSITPPSPMCVATPEPFGGGATPVLVCTLAGVGDGCAETEPGFVGPCIVGDADACPEGFTELVGDATAIVCEPCVQCDSGKYCDGLPYDLFEQSGCAGMPIGAVRPADNCDSVMPPIVSIRAVEHGRLDTGCDPTAAQAQQRRICCVTG